MSIQVCRVCITSDVRMHRIDSNRLQEMFEKVTNTKLHACGRPVSICYICLSQLQKSQRFLEMCQRAEEMFADLITNGIEVEKHSIDMLNIGSVQHIALSVKSTEFLTLKDYSINESSQVAEEPSGIEENANIVYIVKDETDTENFQVEESVLSNNTTMFVTLNKSSQVAVKEEPSGVKENLNIVDIVKNETDTENFQIEESVLSNNTTMFVTLNKSSQVAVKEEPSGVKENNSNIVDIVKNETDTENFQIEESVLSNNITMFVTLNESSQVAVKEEPSGVKENSNIVEIVKDETDTENLQIEERVLSMNTDNIESHYYCDECNYKSSTKSCLVVHLKRHILGNAYSCDRCNKTFSHSRNLVKHMRTHTGEKPYSCNICNHSFSQKGNLDQHIRIHTQKKLFSCSTCNKIFSCKSHLSRHIRTHTGEKPYSCNICNKSFSQRNNMVQHIRTHSGEKPYSCNICNKSFSQRGQLDQHIRIHTKEKLYSCNICNKSFSQKSHMEKHIRIHTVEKPYSCNICNNSFSQIGNLDQHIRIHAKKKQYSCSTCNKIFISKSHLSRHIRTHTGEKPYSCNICNETFSRKSNLNTGSCNLN